MQTIDPNNTQIPVIFEKTLDDDARARLFAHKPFIEWYSKIVAMGGGSVTIRDVAFFGKTPGFIFAEADVKDRQGQPIPSLSFIRGDSVAILVEIEEKNWLLRKISSAKALLVRQARVPTGETDFKEIPAGMVDGGGSFAGAAAKEIQEETGLTITEAMLQPLGTYYPSPGGSDEKIRLFRTRIRVPHRLIKKLEGRVTGNKEEGESITLEVVKLSDLPKRSGNKHGRDMKSSLAYALVCGS